MLGKLLVMLRIPISEEFEISKYGMKLRQELLLERVYCMQRSILWNVSTRLKVKEKSTCVDGISKLSGIEI